MLGLVQGATELLPISSSGHLILVPWLFDWTYLKENDAFNQTFDVVAAPRDARRGRVLLPARPRQLLGALARRRVSRRRIETPDERIAWVVVVATIPAAIVGALGEHLIAEHLGEPWQIAINPGRFGLLLWIADKRRSDEDRGDVSLRQAPRRRPRAVARAHAGVSRSGITITAGRFLGLDRDSAARFSFLLLVPITLGAVVFKGVGACSADLPPGMM